MENLFFIIAGVILTPIVWGIIKLILKLLGVYVIVHERQAIVYTLFGTVVGVLDTPGIHFLWKDLGPSALLINTLGKARKVDLRLDQQYLRNQPVNSEEGAPVGVGIWYEMIISNPVDFLFKNNDPKGSLAANVGNSTIRCLSNLPLATLLQDRHQMSRAVRKEVTDASEEWGYLLGSCYIRKVEFRDKNMIHQIQNKVVNRLRQVTSAIFQEGTNKVNIITSTAEKTAAIDFGKANAVRPQIVGEMFAEISKDPEVLEALCEILEIQRIMENKIPLYQVGQNSQFVIQPEQKISHSS
jgi:regulator of protease activity HflC (stomatin/prohibitin superfamily)